MSPSPQRCRSKLGGLETIASSRIFTLFSAVRFLFCEGQRSMVLWRRWLTASLSSSQPKLLRGAVTARPLQTSLCLRISISISISIFILHARSDMRVYPHSAGQWKCHTRPVVASRLPHASRRSLHCIVGETELGRTAAFTRTTSKDVQSLFSVNNHASCLKTRPQSYWVHC